MGDSDSRKIEELANEAEADTSGLQSNVDERSESDLSLEGLNDLDDGAHPFRRSDSSTSVSFMDFSKMLFVSDFDFGFDLDTVSDETRKRFNRMKIKTKERLKRLKDEGSSKARNVEILHLQNNLIKNLATFDSRIHANLQSSATEKLFYAVAVFLIAASGFIIGKYPDMFHVFHTVLFCILMPIRFYTYFKLSYQYYLADLCYYVNLLLMAFIWWFPDSKSLFISVFSLSMGTLSFAVITWRNSLVLHSIEKTTSSFIHIMPPVTLFVIVHELPKDYLKERFPAVSSIDNWNFINGIIWTSIYYTLWQVCYHYFITIKRKEEIDKGRITSFTYLKNKRAKSGLGKFVNSLPYMWMQVGVFTLIQFGYQLLTMIFCPIWFQYKHFCGAFMVFILIWASYNGATYYIDVFGKRLEKEVEKMKAEIVQLQEQNERLQEMPDSKTTSFER